MPPIRRPLQGGDCTAAVRPRLAGRPAADVDAERDYLFKCLDRSGVLIERFAVPDFHTVREGRNGGGDPWRTDGQLFAGVVATSISP